MTWNLETTAGFDHWVDTLTTEEQIEVAAKVALLREFGPSLRRPHADVLIGSKFDNMKELRGKTSTAQLRMAFAFDPRRVGILLMGGEKQESIRHAFIRCLLRQQISCIGTIFRL